MKKKQIIFNILLFLTFLIIIFVCLNKQFPNDTFYSIKIGKLILINGIDMKDHFSWIPNLPYAYPHWLFDLMVGFIYNLFSFKGLYIFTFILYSILGILIYTVLTLLYKNKILSYYFSIIVIILIKNYAVCRAQLLSYSLFVWFYYSLIRYKENYNKKYILSMTICSIILVNTHTAAWPFLFLLFCPLFASELLGFINNKYKFSKKEYYEVLNIKKIVIVFVIITLTGFISPLKFIPFTYLYNTLIGNTQQYISEHNPIVMYYHKALCVYIFLLLITLKNKNIYISDIFMLMGLAFMMLSSRRHRTLFIIISSIIFCKHLSPSIKEKIRNISYNKFYNIIGVSIIMFLIWYPCIDINMYKIKQNYIAKEYPKNAIKYIKDNINYKSLKIYNEYNIGSYLILNDIKVSIDSRADLYTKEFNKTTDYFNDFVNMNLNNYDDIFKKYKIDYILISRTNNIYNMINYNKDYKEVYIDNNYAIFININSNNLIYKKSTNK